MKYHEIGQEKINDLRARLAAQTRECKNKLNQEGGWDDVKRLRNAIKTTTAELEAALAEQARLDNN